MLMIFTKEPGPYDPCPCGSGKKFKFCCREKIRSEEREKEGPADVSAGERLVAMDVDRSEELSNLAFDEMDAGNIDAALSLLARSVAACPLNARALNNMALCFYLKGDLPGAIECAERVVEKIDGSNDFSLGMLVHYYLLRSREAEAVEAARRMLQVRPADVTHLLKQVEALARLGRHEDVLRLADEGMRRFPESRQMLAFFAGAACANLSQVSRAAPLLDEAAQDPMSGRLAAWYRGLIEKNRTPATLYVRWPYFEANYWLQIDWLMGMLARCDEGDASALRALGGWRFFVDSLLISGKDRPGGDPERNAMLAINLLGFCGTDEALGVLRDMAFGMFGSDETRNTAAVKLVEKGKIPRGEPVEMYIGGEWRKVLIQEIAFKQKQGAAIPDEAQELYEKAAFAAHEGDLELSEKLGRKLLEITPRWPVALHNLATTLLVRGGGKRRREASSLVKKAIEIDPKYVFGKCTMAQLLSSEGRHGEAMDLLDEVDPVGDMSHPGEVAMYHGARLQVLYDQFLDEHGEGRLLRPDLDDESQAETLWQMRKTARFIESLPPSWTGDSLAPLIAKIEAVSGPLESMAPRRNRSRLSRPVDIQGSLEKLLSGYTVGEMRLIARRLRIERPYALGKAALAGRIAKELSGTGQAAKLGQLAGEREANLLEALLGAGGYLPVEDFSLRFDYDPDDDFFDPRTTAGKLRAMGLVHEGVILGKECLFVPGQVFPLARAVLKRNV
jgi:tetratricopeptide (TPR) repeat protein